MNGYISQNGEAEQKRDFLKSPSPPVSSGRRKGKPKKLVNHVTSPSHYSVNTQSDDVNGHSSSGDERENLSVHIPSSDIASRRSTVEEYPVMIIQENSDNVVNGEEGEPLVALQAEGLQANSPTRPNDSANTDASVGLQRKRRHYSNDVLRISNIHSMTMAKDTERKNDACFSHKVIKSEESNYTPSSSISPIFLSKKHVLPPLVSSQNSYSVIKPGMRYAVAEGTSTAYGDRLSHGRVHYILTDSRSGSHLEKRTSPIDEESIKLSPEVKSEPSKLLLKVTSSATVDSHSHLTSHRFPVYQNAPAAVQKIKPRPKEVAKPKANDNEHRPQCSECFQTFKKRAALERHMMIHRGIKPFQCHFCNQRFRQKHHLQGHIMLHTGERPHSCTLCNKRFRMRHHLLEHERISHKVFR
ncbi:myoneurin-like isoform X2 [Hydractinia symbiolongicarpus]|nr:myoneurin-like isoform X2 [Hydractinia symbiolongicarpus]